VREDGDGSEGESVCAAGDEFAWLIRFDVIEQNLQTAPALLARNDLARSKT
jgi:hypothetical protein